MIANAEPDVAELVVSRYLVLVDVSARTVFCGHAVFGRRRLLERRLVELIELFARPRRPETAVDEFLRRHPDLAAAVDPAGLKSRLNRFIQDLAADGLLVPGGRGEAVLVTERLQRTYGRDADGAFGADAIEDVFTPVLPERLDHPVRAAEDEPLSVLLLGWCTVQSLRPVLMAEAARRGFRAAVHVGFPDDHHLIDTLQPDVTVLQLSHRLILAPVLDTLHLLPPAERETRITQAEAAIQAAVDGAAARTGRRLLLVQGLAAPQASPFGAAEPRHEPGLFETVHRLNRAARLAASRHRDALFVDEEAITASFGKRWLMDDLVSTFSHHGILGFPPEGVGEENPDEQGMPGSPLPPPAGRTRFHRLMGNAYLDLYEAWRGRGVIRCVVTDLDGTLWPGRIGDESFDFSDERLVVPLMYGLHAGLHQALQVVRSRGILLAAVSKNDPGVLSKWRTDRLPLGLGVRPEERGHLLRPEDFVTIRLSWRRKSEVIDELAHELGLAPEQLAFIDDHPVEREEVRQALPGVWVLGDDLARVREVLLTAPRFQVLEVSSEASRRTETTRARLDREAARASAGNPAEFLRGLNVRCTVRLERDVSRLGRISELLRRTNQFATTGCRPSVAELEMLLARPDAAVLTLHVQDRFADYGLVGAAVVEGQDVIAFAISCRVIGLEAENVLLRRALERAGQAGPEVRVLFDSTERNLPARRLFLLPGFSALADGAGFGFDLRRHPLPVDPPHCAVESE